MFIIVYKSKYRNNTVTGTVFLVFYFAPVLKYKTTRCTLGFRHLLITRINKLNYFTTPFAVWSLYQIIFNSCVHTTLRASSVSENVFKKLDSKMWSNLWLYAQQTLFTPSVVMLSWKFFALCTFLRIAWLHIGRRAPSAFI